MRACVAVTRSAGQAGALEARLKALGFRVLRMPSVRIAPPEDRRALERWVRAPFDWVVLASPNAARAFLGAGGKVRGRVAAVGEGTAKVLRMPVVRIPSENSSKGLVRMLRSEGVRGRSVLIPRSDIAPPDLPRALRRLGARVRSVTAYRTLPVPLSKRAAAALASGRVDAAVFASASAARSFAASCLRSGIRPSVVRAVSIGPQTSRALRRAGFRVAAEASPHTLPGLVRALRKALKGAAS